MLVCFCCFVYNTFNGPVAINTGADDDTVEVGTDGQSGDSAVFNNDVTFDGGPGEDTVDAGTNTSGRNQYKVPAVIKNVENVK